MTLLQTFASTVELTTYAEIREALFHPQLSRTFDTRSYADGNIREGIVSTQHGAVHRSRRRVENAQFRADKLRLYERELFPEVMNDLLDVLLTATRSTSTRSARSSPASWRPAGSASTSGSATWPSWP